MKGYNILITGASGFAGRYLLKALEQSPHRVTAVVRNPTGISPDLQSGNLKFINTGDPDWKKQVVASDPQVVLHLASFLTSLDDEKTIDILMESNLRFGTHLLNALQQTNVQFFINTGTFAEYDEAGAINPMYLYAATKTAFRNILTYYQNVMGFKWVNVIPYTIYGGLDSNKKLIDHILDSIGSKVPVKMSPGEQVRDFVHINDIVEFFVRLFGHLPQVRSNYSEIHLGTGVGTTPRQIAAIVEEITGKKTNIEWGGLPYRKRDSMYSVAKNNLPDEMIGWRPQIGIREGIRDYLSVLGKIV